MQGFFREHAISGNCPKHVYYEILKTTFHVAFQFCDKLYAIDKEPLEEILSDIAFVTDEFSVNEFNKSLVLKRFAVIYVTWSYHEIQNLSLLVANQVQFESKDQRTIPWNICLFAQCP